MEQSTEDNTNPQPKIDESEYKMPESPLINGEKKDFPWHIILVSIVLLLILGGLSFYLYWGMKNTPANSNSVVEIVEVEETENEIQKTPTVASPKAVAEMKARLEAVPPATPDAVAKMQEALSNASADDSGNEDYSLD